tara:strand:+ start:4588 stop:5382 length:795 start_codon:yes stop_codon:yes gene_type:complete
MATEENDNLYSYLDTEEGEEERQTLEDEQGNETATREGIDEAYEELYGMSPDEYLDQLGGFDPNFSAGERMREAQKFYESGQSQSARERMLERVGLREGTKLYEHAEKLADIAAGKRKTAGEIEAERELAILARAQRGQAMGYGGFNAAEIMQRAGRSAQEIEVGGESAIAQTARKARRAAKDQLEELLIAGEQRAEDRAFNMQQLAFQQDQARGSLWSNVLGGVLGAIGSVVGIVATGGNPAGGVLGGTIGSSMGKGTGQYLA